MNQFDDPLPESNGAAGRADAYRRAHDIIIPTGELFEILEEQIVWFAWKARTHNRR